MNLKFKIHLISALFFTLILCSVVFTLNAQSLQPSSPQNFSDWLLCHWSFVGLVLSEAFAFLPTKAKGITHALFNVATGLFKKKSRLKSKSS